MRHTVTFAVVALLAVPTVGRAQQMQPDMAAAGPLAAALQMTLRREARNMVAAAEAMPADKLGYKPTPEQMTFGQILAHEAESNETLCGALAGGMQTPSESSDGASASKDELVARLRKSFETCGTVVAQLSESALGDSVPFFGGRKVTKARAAIALAQDWADHYAQSAMYLRLNGILPPTARRGM
jgi:hypothetical protein